MARVLHGNVRASDDGRKHFLSGRQEVVWQVLNSVGNKITDGTDPIELLMVIMDRLRYDGGKLSEYIEIATKLTMVASGQIRQDAGNNRSEGETGPVIPVGNQKGGDPVAPSTASVSEVEMTEEPDEEVSEIQDFPDITEQPDHNI